MRQVALIAAALTIWSQALSTEPGATAGVLLLAHGGNDAWDANVSAIARDVDATRPAEVAFGMATRANIQDAVARLEARGVSEIVAVPLFVSSHSSVIRATEFLLGAREIAPPELAHFAKMSHAPGGSGAHDGHRASAGDGARPVAARVPIRMAPALNAHPILAAILADRARSISRDAAAETVMLVAHGPVDPADNALWLRDLRLLGAQLPGYASVQAFSLRDDAPAAVRDAATAELRAAVSAARAAGRDVLIVPVLLSYGGIEQGLKERLEGLEYRMPSQGIAPDARLVDWVTKSSNPKSLNR